MNAPNHEPSPLPHASIEAAIPILYERLAAASAHFRPGTSGWSAAFDQAAQGLFDLYVKDAGADEGTLWLVDASDETLVPAYNNGPDAATLVGSYRQPLSQGIVSSVFITQLGLSESWVYRNAQHDSTVNRLLGKVTAHMIAVPFFFGGEPRGVISAVKLRQPDQEDPEPFGIEGFELTGMLAQILGEIIEFRLQTSILGARR